MLLDRQSFAGCAIGLHVLIWLRVGFLAGLGFRVCGCISFEGWVVYVWMGYVVLRVSDSSLAWFCFGSGVKGVGLGVQLRACDLV